MHFFGCKRTFCDYTTSKMAEEQLIGRFPRNHMDTLMKRSSRDLLHVCVYAPTAGK